MSYLGSIRHARLIDVLAGADGVVVGAANDHRDALQAAFRGAGLAEPSEDELVALKLRITAALAPRATMMLLDVERTAPAAIASGALPGSCGLGVPLEQAGYGDVAKLAVTELMPGFSPRAAQLLGATLCKLLLPFRVDRPAQVEAQEAVVRGCVASCREAGVALVVEPIVYPLDGEDKAIGGRRTELIVAAARRLAALEPDLLKVQYPGSAEACAALDEAIGPALPWVLLGGGEPPDVVERQIADCCAAGASGFIVGRTLFQAALVADADEQERTLAEVSRPLLERFAAVARRHAAPWRSRAAATSATTA